MINAKVNNKNLPKAWCKLEFKTPGGKLPFGVVPNITISLESKDGNYHKSYTTGSNMIKEALTTGEVNFPDVPTEVSMYFSLTYTAPTGKKDAYNSTLKFHYPKLNVIQRLREKKALQMAGYIGDFEIDIISAKIAYSNRYED